MQAPKPTNYEVIWNYINDAMTSGDMPSTEDICNHVDMSASALASRLRAMRGMHMLDWAHKGARGGRAFTLYPRDTWRKPTEKYAGTHGIITDWVGQHGEPPTIAQLQSIMDMSASNVHYHLKRMKALRMVAWQGNAIGTLRTLPRDKWYDGVDPVPPERDDNRWTVDWHAELEARIAQAKGGTS